MCLFQGLHIFSFDMMPLVCQTNYWRGFAFFTRLDELTAFNWLYQTNFVLHQMSMNAYMTMCICFSYDLHLTIKNPLYSPEKRMRLYFGFIIASMTALQSLEIWYFKRSYLLSQVTLNHHQYYGNEQEITLIYFKLLPTGLYFLLSTYACAKAFLSLREPGLGQ